MASPQESAQDYHSVSVKFAPDELERLRKAAAGRGYRQVAPYIRQLVDRDLSAQAAGS